MTPFSSVYPSSLSQINHPSFSVDKQFLTLFLAKKNDCYLSTIPMDIVMYVLNPMLKETATTPEAQINLLDYFIKESTNNDEFSLSNFMFFHEIKNRKRKISGW